MNENPGETPNPLNPTPVAVGPTPNPMDRPMVQAAPVATPGVPVATPTQATTEPVKSPEKKKKTGLIILIIVVLAMLIGGIAVAAVMMNRDSDPVSAAMNKITGGNIPANIVINGNIHIENSDITAQISSVDMDIDSSIVTNSLINDSEVVVTVSTLSGDIELDVKEIYTGEDNIYIEVDGIKDVIDMVSGGSAMLEQPTTLFSEGLSSESEYTSSILGEEYDLTLGDDSYLVGPTVSPAMPTETITLISGIVDLIDNKWIRISADQLESLPIDATLNGGTECFENAVKELRNNGKSLAEMYKKNSFLGSSTEKITLASKKYPVYRLTIDDNKLIDYANAFISSNIYNNISSCIGAPSSAQINESAIREMTASLPNIYVEIDDDSNFSRFYTTFELSNNTGTVTVDLGLSYPTNINISEPNEYMDLQNIIQQLFINMFDFEMPTTTDSTVDIYTEL